MSDNLCDAYYPSNLLQSDHALSTYWEVSSLILSFCQVQFKSMYWFIPRIKIIWNKILFDYYILFV